MNLNQLASEICRREGKKKQVNIAQVKEVLAVLGEILSEAPSIDRALVVVTRIIEHGKRRGK